MGENRQGIFIPNTSTDLKILCGDGKYHNFSGIIKTKTNLIYEIYFDDETYIECTGDHEFIIDGIEIKASNLKIGTKIKTYQNTNKHIIFIDKRKENVDVYDLVNTGPTHSFYAIDIIIKNCVVLDEFAHIQPNMANDFYTSVYPVISSGKNTKIIMISTPKGMNLFYKFWTDAVNKKNAFIPFEVFWKDVPGRDNEWYETTLENIGTERFSQEFECNFLGSSNTLISGMKLQMMTYEDPLHKRGSDIYPVDVYEEPIKEKIVTVANNKLGVDGNYVSYMDSRKYKHIENEKDDDEPDEKQFLEIEHKYVIVVDPAEGKKLDYSAFSVFDITQIPYKQTAKFYSNIIPPILFPSIIYDTAKYYNDALILIEIQSVGLQIADILHMDMEYENILRVSSGNKKSQQISSGHVKNSAPGVKMTTPVKRIGCANIKNLIESDNLLIKDFDTYQELTTFTLSSTGNYQADGDGDNDDLCMTLVIFGWLTTQKYFKELVTHDLRKELQRSVLDYEDEAMLPSLVIDDGLKTDLDSWGDSLWINMNAEHSYLDPYHSYFKTNT